MELIDVIEKSSCTGCMACKNACPRNIIQAEEDTKTGFLYPKIQKEYCINCSICKKVCPVKNASKENTEEIKVYSCKNKNDEIRMKSSSGGIFTLIANYILSQDGVVFGASFDKELKLTHSFANTKEEIDKFRGSKYLQSQIGDSFRKVKEFLEEDRKVLFTGTPCQVEGLLSFLKKDYENLYTQDLICHGVPSPKVWRKYLEYKRKIHKEFPIKVNFRKKDIAGWSTFYMSYTYSNFEENVLPNDDPYMKLFLDNYDLRDTCYNCKFKKLKRRSDITIADFWGINKIRPEMNDEKGTSAVLVNTQKGKEIFENIKDYIVWNEEKIEDVIQYNSSLIKSVDYNKKREEFFCDFQKEDFNYLIKKYL